MLNPGRFKRSIACRNKTVVSSAFILHKTRKYSAISVKRIVVIVPRDMVSLTEYEICVHLVVRFFVCKLRLIACAPKNQNESYVGQVGLHILETEIMTKSNRFAH